MGPAPSLVSCVFPFLESVHDTMCGPARNVEIWGEMASLAGFVGRAKIGQPEIVLHGVSQNRFSFCGKENRTALADAGIGSIPRMILAPRRNLRPLS